MFSSPFKDGIIVVIILLLFFGPKQLPKLSRSLGQSAKELKTGFSEGVRDDEKESGKSDSEKTVA